MIRAENPLTLRYLYVALHDLNLVHMLSALGYYNSYLDWSKLSGVDFGSSLRFEIYETTMFTENELDSQPVPYVKIIFDEKVLKCDKDSDDYICELGAFLTRMKEQAIIADTNEVQKLCQEASD